MRIAIAGGGTGGHTSAGLAVAAILPALVTVELHWIGSRGGVEARRVPEAGIAFHAIPAGKLRRYWDWQNVPDLLFRVPAGLIASRRLLRRLRADLLFATGGFVSLPPAIAARSLGIPVVVHEQTSVPGLANRIVGRLARRVLLTFPPPPRAVFPPGRVRVTGNPLRPELTRGSRDEGLRLLGFRAEAPVVYVTGGAQGANRINRAVGEALVPLLERAQLVHQCGDNPETRDRDWLRQRAQALPADLRARYALRPHVGSELAHVYAAADLVVGRSGAGTVNECCQLGRPALFIPLPGTSGDEQTANARLVERAGGAELLPQASLTPARLVEAVGELLGDRGRLSVMGERARTLAVPDAARRIAERAPGGGGARRLASARRGGERPRVAIAAAIVSPMLAWLVLLQTAIGVSVAGPITSAEYLPLRLAQAKGDFAREGVTVSLRDARSPGDAAEDLARGRAELAATSLDTALRLGATPGPAAPLGDGADGSASGGAPGVGDAPRRGARAGRSGRSHGGHPGAGLRRARGAPVAAGRGQGPGQPRAHRKPRRARRRGRPRRGDGHGRRHRRPLGHATGRERRGAGAR